jgi:hypothetical protein
MQENTLFVIVYETLPPMQAIAPRQYALAPLGMLVELMLE